MQKVTITLEDDILQFVDQLALGNRSAYISQAEVLYRIAENLEIVISEHEE